MRFPIGTQFVRVGSKAQRGKKCAVNPSAAKESTMRTIEQLPATYRARVNWYICVWGYSGYVGAIELYDTKAEVESRAFELDRQHNGQLVVSGGWFDPKTEPRKAIASNATFIDYRSKPIPYLAPQAA